MRIRYGEPRGRPGSRTLTKSQMRRQQQPPQAQVPLVAEHVQPHTSLCSGSAHILYRQNYTAMQLGGCVDQMCPCQKAAPPNVTARSSLGADGGSQTPADGAEAEEPPAKRMKDVLHQTLGRATRAYEDQLGCSIEAAAMQRMQSTMSLQQQQVVATGFR